jgi:hypothetical protein
VVILLSGLLLTEPNPDAHGAPFFVMLQSVALPELQTTVAVPVGFAKTRLGLTWKSVMVGTGGTSHVFETRLHTALLQE